MSEVKGRKQSKDDVACRVQVSSNPDKALRQYEELKASGVIKEALIIAKTKEKGFHILTQGMTFNMIPEALMAAVSGIEQVEQRHNEPRFNPNERVVEAMSVGKADAGVAGPSIPPTIIEREDGSLKPLENEHFISCECGCVKWMVLNRPNGTYRLACTKCGNEVMQHIMYHAEGNA